MYKENRQKKKEREREKRQREVGKKRFASALAGTTWKVWKVGRYDKLNLVKSFLLTLVVGDLIRDSTRAMQPRQKRVAPFGAEFHFALRRGPGRRVVSARRPRARYFPFRAFPCVNLIALQPAEWPDS